MVVAAGFFEVPEGSKGSHLTLLEATEYGWWYAARLPGGQHVAALATDAALLKEGCLDQPLPWMERLAGTRHVAGDVAGAVLIPGQPEGLADAVVPAGPPSWGRLAGGRRCRFDL
jgi:hypothetical protein